VSDWGSELNRLAANPLTLTIKHLYSVIRTALSRLLLHLQS
jgi:hypothetical protein